MSKFIPELKHRDEFAHKEDKGHPLMNLYTLHSKPESLKHHDFHHDTVPSLFWDKYKNNPVELKKREQYIAKDPKYAYLYARDILHGRFPAGEAAIAKSPQYAFEYASNIIKGPWKPGEAAIANWYNSMIEM